MDAIISIIILIILIIAGCMGAFKNETYTNKYARRYATPVKVHLERIKRMEDADKIEKVISAYYGIDDGIEAIDVHYRISDVRGNQIANEAERRYIQIHGEYLDDYQRQALNRTLDYPKFYSLCLVASLKSYCDKMKEQMDSLKTKPAKERRREKIAEAITLCVNEIKDKGKEEYLAPVYAIGKKFDIDTDINLASIFHLGFTIKESTIEENQEENVYKVEDAE
jgi:hypothetical protein